MGSRPLPLLPGYAVITDIPMSFNKRHQFEIRDGIPVTDVVEHRALDRPIATADRVPREHPPMVESADIADKWSKKIPHRDRKEIPLSKKPAWMVYDNHVLRFNAYFREAVHECAGEASRVRRCTLFFYLADDSIHVEELRDHSSGMQQGLLVKRHQIPFSPERYVLVGDLAKIGAEISIYGKTLRITDADPFTRRFLSSALGIDLGVAEPTPIDEFHAKQPKVVRGSTSDNRKQASDITKFVEAQQGKPMPTALRRTRQFLEHDRQVLRFWAEWRDPALYGEKRPFIVHFFRADGSLEVLEVRQANSGRDPFPALLKRVRLPRNVTFSNQAQIGSDGVGDGEDFYNETDFRIGTTISVFGRNLLIIDMDTYTRDFYRKHFGLSESELVGLTADQEGVNHLEGFSAVDDAGEVTGYESHPIAFDALPLRFEAILNSRRPEDHERRFVVTFYKEDSTVSIFEGKVRNSGFVGGKFLDRTHLADLNTTQFYVGSEIRLNGFPFRLVGADAFTLGFMEMHADLFPASDFGRILRRLHDGLPNNGVQGFLNDLRHHAKPEIGLQAFHQCICRAGLDLSLHECLTLSRKFRPQSSDGTFTLGNIEGLFQSQR